LQRLGAFQLDRERRYFHPGPVLPRLECAFIGV
jgi:hypothetical protein